MTADELRATLRVVAEEAGRLRDAGVGAVRVGDVEVRLDGVVPELGRAVADVAVEGGSVAEDDDEDSALARRYRDGMPAHAV